MTVEELAAEWERYFASPTPEALERYRAAVRAYWACRDEAEDAFFGPKVGL